MSDVTRDSFEEWYSEEFDDVCPWDSVRNCYIDVACHYAWKGYQAASKRAMKVSEQEAKDAVRYRFLRSVGHEQLQVLAHYADNGMDDVVDAAIRQGGSQ